MGSSRQTQSSYSIATLKSTTGKQPTVTPKPSTTPAPGTSKTSSVKTSSTSTGCVPVMTNSGFEQGVNNDGVFSDPPWVIYKSVNGTFTTDTLAPKGGQKDLAFTLSSSGGYGILSQLINVNLTSNYTANAYVNFPAGGACSFTWTFQLVGETNSVQTLISASSAGTGKSATGYTLYTTNWNTNYDNSGVRPTQGQVSIQPKCANSGQVVRYPHIAQIQQLLCNF